jgi:hypothetical protein
LGKGVGAAFLSYFYAFFVKMPLALISEPSGVRGFSPIKLQLLILTAFRSFMVIPFLLSALTSKEHGESRIHKRFTT